MTEQNQTANQEVTSDELVTETIQPEQTTNEDKFFGVKTTIGKTPEDRLAEKPKESQETDELEIEVIEDHSKHKNKFGDTKVSINNNLLCYVSGQEKDLFIQEFRELINKYRI